MSDLFDELGKKSDDDPASAARTMGGDLLDEIKIAAPDELIDFSQGVQERMQTLAQDTNAFQATLIGLGSGFATIARGVGLMEPEDETAKAAIEALREEHPVAVTGGEIAGQAAPFVPLGLAAAGIQSLPMRVLASMGIGGLEGGAIARGEGGTVGETVTSAGVGAGIGGALELVMPVIGRLGRQIFRKLGKSPKGPLLTKEGIPTPEFKSAMDEAGVTVDDLTGEVKKFLESQPQGVDVDQAARAARFKAQGIPATAGDITQDFSEQAAEQRILSMASVNEAAEPLRQLKLRQSQAFTSKVDDLIQDLGIPRETGDTVKDALSARKSLLQKEKTALYKKVAETRPQAANVPVLPDDILKAMPDADTIDDISITAPEAVNKLKQALARFGIDQSQLDVLPSGMDPQPLTMANFDRFRKLINNIERSDQTGAIKVITGPIKNALDNEVDMIADAMTKAGVMDESISKIIKKARGTVRQMKQEFSPQSITGRLIGVKRDQVTPIIEASKVTKTLLSPTAAVEDLQRTMASLAKAGKPGQRAINDMQSSVVLNALDDAMRAVSQKTGGVQTISGNQFAKSLRKFDGPDNKLSVLFKDNPKALATLRALEETALDISPTAAATPKGSAPVIMDMINRVGSAPGLAAVRDTINFIIKAGGDERAVRKAMKANPGYKKVISSIERDFPALGSAIGISAIQQEEAQ